MGMKLHKRHASWAKQAAEKLWIWVENGEKHPAWAKARPLFCGICGTLRLRSGQAIEVMPGYKTQPKLSFSAACKAHVTLQNFRHD
jgi:hypothetical protein